MPGPRTRQAGCEETVESGPRKGLIEIAGSLPAVRSLPGGQGLAVETTVRQRRGRGTRWFAAASTECCRDFLRTRAWRRDRGCVSQSRFGRRALAVPDEEHTGQDNADAADKPTRQRFAGDPANHDCDDGIDVSIGP